MTHHDYIGIISRGYEAWNRGDIASVMELVHPDFAWSDPPEVVGARGGTGHGEFELYLRSFSEAWDELRCEPEEFRPAGDALLVVVREGGRGKLSGALVEHRLVHVWRFRDGKAASLEAFVDAAEAVQRVYESAEQLPVTDRVPLTSARGISWQPSYQAAL